jgi:multiple sugar transport system substrate-binding protein
MSGSGRIRSLTRRRLAASLSGAVLADAAAAGALVACGATEQGPAGGGAPAPGARAATVWVYDAFAAYQDMRDQLERLVYQPFATRYPHLTVTRDSVTSAEFYEKAPVLFAGGTAPDLLWVQTFAHYTFIAQNLALDLAPLAARDKAFNLPDFWDKALSSLRKGSGLYGLPYNMQTIAVFYNKQLFQQAGVPFPKDTWTWQDFTDTAKRLTKTDATSPVFGALPLGAGAWQLESVLLQAGGSVLNPERTAPTLESAGSLQALQWMADLRTKERVAPSKGNPLGQGQGFTTGQAAMSVTDLPARDALKRAATPIDYDVAPLPKGPRSNLSVTGGGAYWIGKPSGAPEEAFLLLTALLSKEAAPAYGTTGIPGRRSASELIKEPGQPPANVQVFLEAMKDAPGPTWAEHLQNRKIWQACGPPLQGAFDGDTSVREAAAHAQREIAAVMAQG